MERSDWSDEEPFAFRQPLPPEDRVWRHPSELSGGLTGHAVGPIAAADTSGAHTWAVAVVAGLIGSALSLGFVAASGGLSGDVVEKAVVEKVAVRPAAELIPVSSNGPSVMVQAWRRATVARIRGRMRPAAFPELAD